jgi:hypothetical protein
VYSLLSIRCAISWLVEADQNGPTSPACRHLANLHDICLKNRKQGYQLFDEHNNNSNSGRLVIPSYPAMYPHYYFSGAGKAKSSNKSSKSYHSTSVLGRLFDYSQFTVMAVEKAMHRSASPLASTVTNAVVLDPDFNIDAMLCLSDKTDKEDSASQLSQQQPMHHDCSDSVNKELFIKKHKFLQAATDLFMR